MLRLRLMLCLYLNWTVQALMVRQVRPFLLLLLRVLSVPLLHALPQALPLPQLFYGAQLMRVQEQVQVQVRVKGMGMCWAWPGLWALQRRKR